MKTVATTAKTAMITRHCFTTPLVEQGRTPLPLESFEGSQGTFVVDGSELVAEVIVLRIKTPAGLVELSLVVLE